MEFSNVVGICDYSIVGDDVFEVSKGGFDPLAFTGLDFESCFSDMIEDQTEVLNVFFQSLEEYDDVIEVDIDELSIIIT
jgi:hypothetical protein